MAMSAAHLSAAIKASLLTRSWVANNVALIELCDSLAGAIVAEVQAARVTIPAGATSFGLTTTPGNPIGPVPAPIPIDGSIS